MENAEEIFHFLEDFSKRKPKTIPQELNEYLAYVARTGDPVYQWSLVKSLFKEKLLSVITDFYETSPGIEIPPYPNVDPFNYDIMKNSLLERFDSFTSAPFTVQRICELLTFPRKQYNRVDKFMRAIEKNILVVSTREPGLQRQPEENGEANEPMINGSDNNSEYNVDVEMEDMSWKENNVQQSNNDPQPSSSETHISVDDIEARLKAKEDAPMDTQEKATTQYESLTPPGSITPPDLDVNEDSSEIKPNEELPEKDKDLIATESKNDTSEMKQDQVPSSEVEAAPVKETKDDVEMKTEVPVTLVIPEIKVDDAEMTEQKLLEASKTEKESKIEAPELSTGEAAEAEVKPIPEPETPQTIDESSSDSKDEIEIKISDVLTSSEESSSSSDNTDGNSNSPKTEETNIEIQEELKEETQSDANSEMVGETKPVEDPTPVTKEETIAPKIETENYSISDVNSELKHPPLDGKPVPEELVPETVPETETVEDKKEETAAPESESKENDKSENLETISDNKEPST